MKKILAFALVIVILFGLSACGQLLSSEGSVQYDDQGRVIREPLNSSSYQTHEYGEDGVLTKTTVFSNDDELWLIYYYENGLCALAEDYTAYGGEKIEKTTFAYNENKQLIREDRYLDDEATGYTLYSYNDQGLQQSITHHRADGKETDKNTMEYDDNGDMIRQDSYSYGDLIQYELFEYHAPGVKKHSTSYDSEGLPHAEIFYDESGNITKYIRYEYNGTESWIAEVVEHTADGPITTTYTTEGRYIVTVGEFFNIEATYYYHADGTLAATDDRKGFRDANGNEFEPDAEWFAMWDIVYYG